MWMQLVLTWGQNMTGRVLQVTPATVTRARDKHALSDVELFALYLAEQITVEGEDITGEMKTLGREQLAARNVLATHSGDAAETSTILLAAQTLTNRTSPELHAEWDGEPAHGCLSEELHRYISGQGTERTPKCDLSCAGDDAEQ